MKIQKDKPLMRGIEAEGIRRGVCLTAPDESSEVRTYSKQMSILEVKVKSVREWCCTLAS